MTDGHFPKILTDPFLHRDRQTIIFERDLQYPFLMAPAVAFLLGLYAVVRGWIKIGRCVVLLWRRRQGYLAAEGGLKRNI